MWWVFQWKHRFSAKLRWSRAEKQNFASQNLNIWMVFNNIFEFRALGFSRCRFSEPQKSPCDSGEPKETFCLFDFFVFWCGAHWFGKLDLDIEDAHEAMHRRPLKDLRREETRLCKVFGNFWHMQAKMCKSKCKCRSNMQNEMCRPEFASQNKYAGRNV